MYYFVIDLIYQKVCVLFFVSKTKYDIKFNQNDLFFGSAFIYFSTWLSYTAAMSGATATSQISGRLRGVIIPQIHFSNTKVLANLIKSNSTTNLKFTVDMTKPNQPKGKRIGTIKLFEFLGQQTLGHSYELAKPLVETKYGTSRKTTWPAEMQFFYHIRNGVFHGNKFNIKRNSFSSTIPATWRGKMINNSDNNRKVVQGFLFPADIIHLLYDIQKIL